ncbi:hypothetical protein [uncultured Tateyamaria sp.]|uniref:hypothetical protein n=1 Tax=uncultured Tateyamaria sp. TaxID=455651 RepID=UPI00262EB008|nr:hypothetical protein [uncultured Tateyamaria sp.]
MKRLPQKLNRNKGVSLRSDAKRTHEILCGLIRQTISDVPHKADTTQWTQPMTLSQWGEVLGVHERTVRRMIRVDPIRYDVRRIDGQNVTLLRLDDGSPDTPRTVAKRMVKVWEGRYPDYPVKPKVFGMLVGMAKEWPPGLQVDVFAFALKNWTAFNSAMKAEMEFAEVARRNGWDIWHPDALADHYLETARRMEGEKLRPRFYRFPSPPVLLKFSHIAEWLYRSEATVPEDKCPFLYVP